MMCRGVPAVLTPLCTSKDACNVIYTYRMLLGTQSTQAVLQARFPQQRLRSSVKGRTAVQFFALFQSNVKFKLQRVFRSYNVCHRHCKQQLPAARKAYRWCRCAAL